MRTASALTLLWMGALGAAERPYFEARRHPTDYVGPGREDLAPKRTQEVKFGWFGPSNPRDPVTGPIWQAANLAVEAANEAGGHNGRPFRLLPVWSENAWGTGVSDLARLVYKEKVWGIVGSIDGPSTHLAEQVVAKARLPLVSPVSTDKTANLANVPWMFSCAPGDHAYAPIMAKALVAASGGRPFAMLSCIDHDSRVAAKELVAALGRLNAHPALHLDFKPGVSDLSPQLTRIERTQPAAIAILAGPLDSARAVIAVRERGLRSPLFGGPAMGRSCFMKVAGEAAEGAHFPLLYHPAGKRASDFSRRFTKRFGAPPDYAAAHAYDAVSLLIAAVRKAGLNRARIRDAIRALSPWQGLSGPITWDATGQNERPVCMGMIRGGRATSVGKAG